MRHLPRDLWILVVNRLDGIDAAAFACVSRDARVAHRASRAFRAVRVARDGTVLEPATGTCDVEVAPGEPVAEALARCPPGGSVLLRPGVHDFPPLDADKEVHVFGRDAATVQTSPFFKCTARTRTATFVNVCFTCEVTIDSSRVRFQGCAFTTEWVGCMEGADVTFAGCRIDAETVIVEGEGTLARFERNLVKNTRLIVESGATSWMINNTIHGGHRDFGIYVRSATATVIGNVIAATGTGITVIDCNQAAQGDRVLIERNEISMGVVGVVLTSDAEADIIDNLMWENKFSITIHNDSNAVVRGNHLWGDGGGSGISVFGSGSGGLVTNNEIACNRMAVHVQYGACPTLVDNVFRSSWVGVHVGNARCAMKRNRTRNVLIPRLAMWHLRVAGTAVMVATVAAMFWCRTWRPRLRWPVS